MFVVCLQTCEPMCVILSQWMFDGEPMFVVCAADV